MCVAEAESRDSPRAQQPRAPGDEPLDFFCCDSSWTRPSAEMDDVFSANGWSDDELLLSVCNDSFFAD
jgi:hypothetical protein